jgi:RNA polymerase sigma factor (sigma-70 family)
MNSASADCDLVSDYVREGSENAFRALVSRHVNLVYATALRQVGEAGVAEEVTQNVFVCLARKAPRLGGVETLAGWLHRTTVLESKSRIRAELRRRRRDETAAELASIQHEGSSTLESLVPLLDEGLLNLRDSDRTALVLRFLEERSMRDVGVMLGVDEDAARKRVSRALDRLAEFFRHRGFAVGTGTAALLAGAVKAAPATLASSAGSTALAAGTTTSTLQLLLFHVMSATKTQTAIACLVLAAAPLAWQIHAGSKLAREQQTASAELSAARLSASQVEQQFADAAAAVRNAQSDAANFQARLVQANAQRTGRSPRRAYQWDDNSPVIRVPKQMIAMLPFPSLADRRGRLSDQAREALQFSDTEAAEVQTSIDRFLAGYAAAQSKNMHVVEPTKSELNGHKPEETRVFEMTAIGDAEMKGLREELFRSTDAALGTERAKIFQKGLGDWMPMDEEFHGLNSGMAVFNIDRREKFFQPKPGDKSIQWSFSSPVGQSTMYVSIPIDEIPDLHRAQLQDWIALAKSKPATEVNP